MFDPATVKSLVVAAFNGGLIYGSIKAGNKRQREQLASLQRRVNRLRRYKEWSHRALSIIIAVHRQHHPQDQHLIDDWNDNGHNGDDNGV